MIAMETRFKFNTGPLSREKTDTILLALACLAVISNHFETAMLWISLTSCALMLLRVWLTFSGRALPRNIILIPTALILMGGIFYNYHSFFGREAGVAMLILLLACKMLEMHARRDLFVVVFLGLFLILTSFFESQSLLSALQVSISALLLLVAQLSFQFHSKTIAVRRRFTMILKLIAYAIPLTITCFFLFPRLQGPLWGLPSDANVARTGLSNSMSPGNISKLAMSEELVFRVRFLDRAPEKAQMYWRANVLDEFDGRTWTSVLVPDSSKLLSRNALLISGKGIKHEVTLEATGERSLFALDMPNTAPEIEAQTTLFSRNAEIFTQVPLQQRIRYQVTSFLDYILNPQLNESSYRINTSLLRRFNPKTAEFAKAIRSQYKSPEEQIQAILNFYHNEKFFYTLEPPSLGRDSVDDFLFKTRAGFCEHYASSFVILMRYLDIPARVVTGYQGGTLNTQDGFYEIRQSDAHAWAEVWLNGKGWMRVDPTAAVAPDRILKNLKATQNPTGIAGIVGNMMSGSSIFNEIRMRWSALNNSWNQWVLNYNETKQNSLFERLGFKNLDWTQALIRIFLIGLVLLGLTALPLIKKRQSIAPLDKLYSQLSEKLKRHGLERLSYEGPQNYLKRIQASLKTTELSVIREFIALYTEAKYGLVPPEQNISELRKLLRQLT